jgi:hypothetical protein
MNTNMSSTNLPKSESQDSSEEVRSFFDRYFRHQITFPSNQIDAVVGFFVKRGFDIESARSTGIVMLNQAKIDNINVFKLLDTLKGLNDSTLSSVVTEVLNAYREKSSILGFKLLTVEETTESRNIIP